MPLGYLATAYHFRPHVFFNQLSQRNENIVKGLSEIDYQSKIVEKKVSLSRLLPTLSAGWIALTYLWSSLIPYLGIAPLEIWVELSLSLCAIAWWRITCQEGNAFPSRPLQPSARQPRFYTRCFYSLVDWARADRTCWCVQIHHRSRCLNKNEKNTWNTCHWQKIQSKRETVASVSWHLCCHWIKFVGGGKALLIHWAVVEFVTLSSCRPS